MCVCMCVCVCKRKRLQPRLKSSSLIQEGVCGSNEAISQRPFRERKWEG